MLCLNAPREQGLCRRFRHDRLLYQLRSALAAENRRMSAARDICFPVICIYSVHGDTSTTFLFCYFSLRSTALCRHCSCHITQDSQVKSVISLSMNWDSIFPFSTFMPLHAPLYTLAPSSATAGYEGASSGSSAGSPSTVFQPYAGCKKPSAGTPHSYSSCAR